MVKTRECLSCKVNGIYDSCCPHCQGSGKVIYREDDYCERNCVGKGTYYCPISSCIYNEN